MRVSVYALVVVLLISLMTAVVTPGAASAGSYGLSTKHVTLVYGHPIRLTVSLEAWSRTTEPNGYAMLGKGTTKVTATIARIVEILNQVNVPNLQHTCPRLPGSRSILRFSYANGDVWTVYEGGCWNFSGHEISGTGVGDPPCMARSRCCSARSPGSGTRMDGPADPLFCSRHPRTRGHVTNVRGYYYAFRRERARLPSVSCSVRDRRSGGVLRAGSIPGHIGFGIFVSIVLVRRHYVRLEPATLPFLGHADRPFDL